MMSLVNAIPGLIF